MKKKFIINGRPIEIDIRSSKSSTKLIPVTPLGETWAKYAPTGAVKVYLSGILPDGKQVDKTFIRIDQLEDGTEVLASETYPIPVG